MADTVVVRSAPAAPMGTAGRLFDRREVLGMQRDIGGAARGLRLGFVGDGARCQKRRRKDESDHQLPH